MGCNPERIGKVREIISSGSVVWESVVWVSTSQLVFPALYMQVKRAGLLPDLPHDLVEYMTEFSSLNRERNNQIILQAKRISPGHWKLCKIMVTIGHKLFSQMGTNFLLSNYRIQRYFV